MPSDQDRIALAQGLYERAVFHGEGEGLDTADRELDSVEAELALVRGRVIHARFLADRGKEDPRELELFERAAALHRELGDLRGEGEALFWIGTFHQVVRDDHETANPFLARSLELATEAGDGLTMSYALRHLAFTAHMSGDIATAIERMEESTRLRRELAFWPGVAANLLGLAHMVKDDGRLDDARALLDEAAELAESSGAAGVAGWIEGSRGEF